MSILVQVIAWCHQATSYCISQCWPRSMSPCGVSRPQWVNTLRPRQHRRRFADDIFKCIFFNENCCILIKISLKYVRKGPIDNKPALVQIMAWRRLGDKPFSEPVMVSLPTHICVTRPQWVKQWSYISFALIYWYCHVSPASGWHDRRRTNISCFGGKTLWEFSIINQTLFCLQRRTNNSHYLG